MPDPVVVIPAHGRGTRLGDVTRGLPKTLVAVAGEQILGRLLRAAVGCAAAGRRVRTVVYTQPGDAHVPAFLAARGSDAELGRREPQGYLHDIVAISEAVGEEFTVLDSDLITPCGELTGFLLSAAGAGDPAAAMVFGVSGVPPAGDPRSIRPAVTAGRLRLGPGTASHLPRAIGAYHWRPAAVARARAFVAERARARAAASFHDYVGHLAAAGAPAAVISFSAAVNVNTPGELQRAAGLVRQWRAQGRD